MTNSMINAVIHVVSSSGLGYVGTLVEMDLERKTFTVSQVRCLGTEGRQPDNEVPGTEEVYPVIVFNSSDVCALDVVSLPPTPPTPPPSSSNVEGRSVFDQPAPSRSVFDQPAPSRSVFDQPAPSRSVFDQPTVQQTAIVTIVGLAQGTTTWQVAELFADRTSIVSVRILILPPQHQHQGGRYAADVVFTSHNAASQALLDFNHPELSIDFSQQPLQSTSMRSDYNPRGGGGYQDARRKNAETFGQMAFEHRSDHRGGRGGSRGGRGHYRGNSNNYRGNSSNYRGNNYRGGNGGAAV
ncbi:hypothetical protein BASA81_012148 [Batrachochytrium salamandrivorans]|nr:hypothetical protein BASA81_012148 [Batrachochytrium salamandrivorans]